jgi:hypothetical protein
MTTICQRSDGVTYTTSGACKAGEVTLGAATTTPGAAAATPGSTVAPGAKAPEGAWMPRLPETVHPSTTSSADVAYYSEPNGSAWNTVLPATQASAQYESFPQWQPMFQALAVAAGGRSGKVVYERLVTQSAYLNSQGIKKSPFQLGYEEAMQKGLVTPKGAVGAPTTPTTSSGGSGSHGGGGGGGGGAAAPLPADPSSVKRAMDTLATGLIGRTLSDKEFTDYYKTYTGAFAGNPNIDMAQHGTESLQQDEGYQEFQVAQKFSTAFDSVIKGAM